MRRGSTLNMGYSSSIPCRSKKAQEQMLAFLDLHYRDHVDAGIGTHRRREKYAESSGLKYARGACGIGFNSPGDYEHALLRWMALRVGKRRTFRGLGISRAIPWTNCDDRVSEPILLNSDWPEVTERQEQYLVDADGFAPLSRYWREDDEEASKLEAHYADLDAKIGAELRRLSSLWEQRDE